MRRIVFFLIFLLFCAGFATAENQSSSDTAVEVSAETSAVISFFQSKAKEVEALHQDVKGLQAQLEKKEEVFAPTLEMARSRLQMIEVMARMSKTNPHDMQVALVEAKFLGINLDKEFEPLNSLSKELGLKAATVQALSEDLEKKWGSELDKEWRQDVQKIRKSVAEVAQALKTAQKKLEQQQVVVADIQTRIQDWVISFETQLPQIWKAQFFEETKFQIFPKKGADVGKELQDWFTNMRSFFISQYTTTTRDSGDWGGSIVLFWFPYLLFGFISYRYLSGVFANTHTGGRLASAFGIFCLSAGLMLLTAFFSGKVKQTSLLLICAHLLNLTGIQALAWIFRNVRGVVHKKTIQPLLPLVFLSSSVGILYLLRLPPWLARLAWVGLLVFSSLFFGMIRPKLRYERIIRRLHPYVAALLVIVAVLGWGNLAILASTMWGVLALAGQLTIGATSVIRVVSEQMDKTGLQAVVSDLIATFLMVLVWVVIILGVIFWMTINFGTNAIFDKLSTLEVSWGDFSFNFLRLGMVLLLFQLVRSLATVWKAVLGSEKLRGKNIDSGAAASLQRIGIYCLWLLFGLISLNMLGINLSNFAVIAGGLSVGIGFGLQAIISNFISGLILLFDRAIQPGDVIEVDGVWAVVISVNIRNTEVQTYDNAKIFLPNSILIANKVINWTHRKDMRVRREIPVSVMYGSDIQLVKKLLLEAASEHPAILPNPAPVVIFNDFGPNALNFFVRLWVRHIDYVTSAPSEIREAIDHKFREHGVEIALPQMHVRMRPEDGAVHIKMEEETVEKY